MEECTFNKIIKEHFIMEINNMDPTLFMQKLELEETDLLYFFWLLLENKTITKESLYKLLNKSMFLISDLIQICNKNCADCRYRVK